MVWQVFYATPGNLFDFAFGANAGGAAGNAGLSPFSHYDPTTAENDLAFSYRRRIETVELSYSVELSDVLASWHVADASEIEQLGPPVGNADGVTETVSIRVKAPLGSSSLPQRFARVRVVVH